MPENGHFGHFDHFQAWSPRVAKGRQGIQNRAIFPLKSPEIPIKNENGLQFVISWSITLKIELWAPYTHWQTVLKGEVILRQKAYFGPD